MRYRNLLLTTALCVVAATGQAQWSVVILHPSWGDQSRIDGVSRYFQGGNVYGKYEGRFRTRAAVWSGLGESWTDLHPPGVDYYQSEVFAVDGNTQGGFFNYRNIEHACLWRGSRETIVNLHPPGATHSRVFALSKKNQVGFVNMPGVASGAALWRGTAGSRVDLHPIGHSSSVALITSGDTQLGSVDGGAALWRGTAESYVNLHPDGADHSKALIIAGSKQYGTVYLNSLPQGGSWSGSASSWTDFTPAGAQYSSIGGGNELTQVGYVDGRACLWHGDKTSWVNLHPAVATVSSASGAFENIQVGRAIVNGFSHASAWSGSAESWTDLHLLLSSRYSSSRVQYVASDGLYVYASGFATGDANAFEPGQAILWIKPGPENFTLNLNRSSVVGENTAVGTITMLEVRDHDVSFSVSDDSALVSTPNVLTIPAGSISKNFLIAVNGITSTVNTTIYARRGKLTRSHPLQLSPLIPTAISFSPSSVTGGQTTTARVFINGVAGAGGRTVAIFDDSAFADSPRNVTIPAGATSAAFPITTRTVTSPKTVRVTARVSAGEETGTFRILPP